jgi:hypothetical protein
MRLKKKAQNLEKHGETMEVEQLANYEINTTRDEDNKLANEILKQNDSSAK